MIAEDKVEPTKSSGDFSLNYLHMQYPWFSQEEINKIYDLHNGDMHAVLSELDEKSRTRPALGQEE
jgi:hypothetical protein